MTNKETKVPLQVVSKTQPKLVADIFIALLAAIQFSPAVRANPLDKGQIPFDPHVWRVQSGKKMSMMASAIKQRSFIGWKKAEMDQSFELQSRNDFDGHQLYYLNGAQRAGYALEVVYKDNLVHSYRLVKFDGHWVDWHTDWVK